MYCILPTVHSSTMDTYISHIKRQKLQLFHMDVSHKENIDNNNEKIYKGKFGRVIKIKQEARVAAFHVKFASYSQIISFLYFYLPFSFFGPGGRGMRREDNLRWK